MAARKNVCSQVELLHMAAWTDGTWRVKGKHRTATTRIMICRFHWKQNIGHLGNDVTVMGVHAYYRTMNMLFPESVNCEWWGNVRDLIVEHKVDFLVGDWNMSLPQVVPRLTKLGLLVDVCAWYPWLHEEDNQGGYYFGMDSCAASCKLQWDFDRMNNSYRGCS